MIFFVQNFVLFCNSNHFVSIVFKQVAATNAGGLFGGALGLFPQKSLMDRNPKFSSAVNEHAKMMDGAKDKPFREQVEIARKGNKMFSEAYNEMIKKEEANSFSTIFAKNLRNQGSPF